MGSTRSVSGLAGWLGITFAAAWVGSRYMPGAWYAALAKPAWTPPDGIFAPVWTALYCMMAVAAWLVWRRASGRAGLVLFVVQLVLNALWSYLFFGLHRADIAFFDIVALWLAILIDMVLFWRVDWRAGALMLPYVLWVGFALCLNFALWRLNA